MDGDIFDLVEEAVVSVYDDRYIYRSIGGELIIRPCSIDNWSAVYIIGIYNSTLYIKTHHLPNWVSEGVIRTFDLVSGPDTVELFKFLEIIGDKHNWSRRYAHTAS